jgi:hypothetical protein
MLQLTLAYVQQTTREREVETDLQTRQMLRSMPLTMTRVEVLPPSTRAPRPAPVRARATSR